MTDRQAYDEGYDAYWDGMDVSDNPYNKETEAIQQDSWKAGWREARKHDYDENEG
jgi:ribosome modulation factor